MSQVISKLVASVFLITLISCHVNLTSGNGNGNVAGGDDQKVQWDSVPAEFSPRVETVTVNFSDVKKIEMNLFAFKDDVQVQYSNQVPANTLQIQLYTVSKDARTSLNGIDDSIDGQTLKLQKNGNYECSMEIHNQAITAVKGACYVRVLLILPEGAPIEIYNVDKLISQRFFAMTNTEFLTALHRASWDPEKMAVIDSFLASYQETGKTASLTCDELGQALREFPFSDAKLQALAKLHPAVSDRQNLGKMIDREFPFDAAKARAIVGI